MRKCGKSVQSDDLRKVPASISGIPPVELQSVAATPFAAPSPGPSPDSPRRSRHLVTPPDTEALMHTPDMADTVASRPLAFGGSRRLSDLRNCEFHIASTLGHVLEAWRVLYEAYLRAGYISPNVHQLHTVPEAVGPHALVLLGRSHGHVISTISAIGDSPAGLPLDKAYPEELAAMRRQGGRLLEIGLFGDRRDIRTAADRSFTSVFELMRYTFFFGLHTGVTDFLCGIPPRRAPLYARCFGFRPVGEVKSYRTVEDNPVVLMHARTDHLLRHPERYRAVDCFMKNPLAQDAFRDRFHFDPAAVAGSNLAEYLGGTQTSEPAAPAIAGSAGGPPAA